MTQTGENVRTPCEPKAASPTKLVAVAAWFLLLVICISSCRGDASKIDPSDVEAPKPEPTASVVKFEFPDKDYGKFDHQSEQHVRLPCQVCHTNDGQAAKVKFTGHIPCSSCHTEHFAEKNVALCSICHTDAESGNMKSFPPLRSFNARFDHARHTPHANCATCHSPTQRGTGFSVPTRANAHTTCFQCHGADAAIAKSEIAKGNNIDSCATCHQQGTPGAGRGFAKYAGGFSHAKHGGPQRLSCNSCHTIQAGARRDRQVSAPETAMHFAAGRGQSCATCHNGKRAFGGEDFSSCKRCHQGDSFKF